MRVLGRMWRELLLVGSTRRQEFSTLWQPIKRIVIKKVNNLRHFSNLKFFYLNNNNNKSNPNLKLSYHNNLKSNPRFSYHNNPNLNLKPNSLSKHSPNSNHNKNLNLLFYKKHSNQENKDQQNNWDQPTNSLRFKFMANPLYSNHNLNNFMLMLMNKNLHYYLNRLLSMHKTLIITITIDNNFLLLANNNSNRINNQVNN